MVLDMASFQGYEVDSFKRPGRSRTPTLVFLVILQHRTIYDNGFQPLPLTIKSENYDIH
jgi:hypothetical protein